MNCRQFDELMADALGNELAAEARLAFDEHIRGCERCRRDFESATATIANLRSLVAPPNIAFDPVVAEPRRQVGDSSASPRRARFTVALVLRYAATIALAFIAGYLFRGESEAPTPHPRFAESTPRVEMPSRSFESVLAGVHLQNPNRSDLAKCMIALVAERR